MQIEVISRLVTIQYHNNACILLCGIGIGLILFQKWYFLKINENRQIISQLGVHCKDFKCPCTMKFVIFTNIISCYPFEFRGAFISNAICIHAICSWSTVPFNVSLFIPKKGEDKNYVKCLSHSASQFWFSHSPASGNCQLVQLKGGKKYRFPEEVGYIRISWIRFFWFESIIQANPFCVLLLNLSKLAGITFFVFLQSLLQIAFIKLTTWSQIYSSVKSTIPSPQ